MRRGVVPAGGGDEADEEVSEAEVDPLEAPTVMLKATVSLRGELRSVVPAGRASTLRRAWMRNERERERETGREGEEEEEAGHAPDADRLSSLVLPEHEGHGLVLLGDGCRAHEIRVVVRAIHDLQRVQDRREVDVHRIHVRWHLLKQHPATTTTTTTSSSSHHHTHVHHRT
jgi:hypothetical protein